MPHPYPFPWKTILWLNQKQDSGPQGKVTEPCLASSCARSFPSTSLCPETQLNLTSLIPYKLSTLSLNSWNSAKVVLSRCEFPARDHFWLVHYCKFSDDKDFNMENRSNGKAPPLPFRYTPATDRSEVANPEAFACWLRIALHLLPTNVQSEFQFGRILSTLLFCIRNSHLNF